MPAHTPDPRTTAHRSVHDLVRQARRRRGPVDLWELMADLRAALGDEEVGAVLRLFRGYCD